MLADEIKARAALAAPWFTTRKRDNGDEYVCRKDGAPEWVADLCREAHNGFPDDWRYREIANLLDLMSEANFADDFGDLRWSPDTSYHDLATWLGSNGRHGYVDEAIEDMGGIQGGIMDAIQLGQEKEAQEIHGMIVNFLRDLDLPDEGEDE